MKYGFVKVRALAPDVRVGDTEYNAQQIIKEIEKAAQAGVEVLLFPELSVCGYTVGDLLFNGTLLDGCVVALEEIAAATAGKKMLVFVGAPLEYCGKLYDCAVAISDGEIAGVVPKGNLSACGGLSEERYFSVLPEGESVVVRFGPFECPMAQGLLFYAESAPEIAVTCELGEDLFAPCPPSVKATKKGALIVFNLSASAELVGRQAYRHTFIASQSGRCACAYVYASAGMGESASDSVYAGSALVYENGKCLAEAKPFSGEYADGEIDAEFLLYERRRQNTFCAEGKDSDLYVPCDFLGEGELRLRKVSRSPFLPDDPTEQAERAELILNIQSHALARRLSHTNSQTAVLGISGGLDSTLALLVTVRAFDLLEKPRSAVLGYTMPGFGTSKKTKSNSVLLMEALGVTCWEIPIADTVSSHFKDIGHDPQSHNVTYENAQARYRTMLLMDLANDNGGLVVGTGDLSELALGWCTYNGDHMSMYAVNGSVPKTLVKHLVSYEAKRLGGKAQSVLESVLATDISPELLPPDKSGNISQKTENIVGPYELHDFYLYHFLRRGDSPAKTLCLAERAFPDYDRETLKKWLVNFYKRFITQQFKRSCSPDGVKVGSVSLSPHDFHMPSDAVGALWLKEAEEL